MISETGPAQPFPNAADINAVLQESGGDHRAAIAALLHDVAALASDYGLSVSRGYVRRETHLNAATAMRRRPGE